MEQILGAVDPRLSEVLRQAVMRAGPRVRVPPEETLVLAGHRAAGKTRLLPLIGALTGRTGLDLDAELERHSGRSLRTWVAEAPESFRSAERARFEALPRGGLVAVGGGFLSHHPEALAGCTTVLIPITFETYCERLRADATRPRLRPEVSLEEELRSIFDERETLHSRAATVALEHLLRGSVGEELA